MKETEENKIDQLFHAGFDQSAEKHAFRESDWEAMEQLLDDKRRRRSIIPWYYVSGIAAMLLLGFGWYFLGSNVKPDNHQPKNIAYNPVKSHNNSVKGAQTGQQSQASVTLPSTGLQKKLGSNEAGPGAGAELVTSVVRGGRSLNRVKQVNKVKNNTPAEVTPNQPVITANVSELTENPLTLAAIRPEESMPAAALSTDAGNVILLQQTIAQSNYPVKKVKASLNRGPRFSLSLVAAPDLNGVSSMNKAQVGTNAGMLFSVQLGKKWSISTGGAYAVKPYYAGASQYDASTAGYKFTPSEIYANCKVLDIPLNVSYQVYSKGRNAFALGTGLSSYFMLREHYAFEYNATNKYAAYTTNYDISNQNRHIMSILNLNATYQRQLNSRFSAIVQPYYKVPLTGIGSGKVNLQSTGVAVGFSWNIGARNN